MAARGLTTSALPTCRGCGCTPEAACPGGCAWVAPDLCSRCAGVGEEAADAVVALEVPMLVLLAVHGTLCLGLRHPAHQGPSRALVEGFVTELEGLFLETGLLTEAQVAELHRTEAAEAPRVVLARA